MHERSIMRIVVLASLLIAGSVSFVAAKPDHDESTDRYRLTDTPHHQVRRDGDWIELASPTPVKHQREYISLARDTGKLSRIRIDAHTGRPIVLTVRINFKDGTSKIARVDSVVDKRRPAVIELKEPRFVESLVVVTDPVSSAEYRVMGLPEGTGVARE